jgi:phosphoribosylamine--glycine ligase
VSVVLVVGGGGRENAIAWKLSRSPGVSKLVVAPGNPGFAPAWERWPVALGDGRPAFEALARRARAEGVTLAVIGPDNALADGIADVFEEAGVPTFGPRAAAARIEASKAFAKDVMAKAGVPTARFQTVRSASEAERFLGEVEWGTGWVVKADGLALGKGVRVCQTRQEAIQAARELVAISGSLVIEERLQGQELSWLAFCDGERAALLEPARDYKRLLEGDEGPNTGGMGAFSPVPGITPELGDRALREIFLPTLKELKSRGAEFRGVLYAGLMVDFSGPHPRLNVLEFNARFGDPETQVLLPRMEGDLLEWCRACASGDLSRLPSRVPFSRDAAVVVIGAAPGYPESPEKGIHLERLEAALRGNVAPSGHAGEKPAYFCAGVGENAGAWVSAGGRVFGAMGYGATLESARTQAYARLDQAAFARMQGRRDIAADIGGARG